MEMAALAAMIQRRICIALLIAFDSNRHSNRQWLPSAPASSARTSIQTWSSSTRLIWIKFCADACRRPRAQVDQEDDGRSSEAVYFVVTGFFIVGGACLVAGLVAVVACVGRYFAMIAGSICAMLVSVRRVQVSSLPNSEMPR